MESNDGRAGMKALVLAGGSGTRLRPFTHTSAKQLVPVGNKPVLFYALESIARAGITEVGIVVGDTAADIRRAVGDGGRFGLEVTYLHQDRPRGLAHAVLIAREYLGDEDFVMYLGDNFIANGITALVEGFRRDRPAAQILLARVPDPAAFGVAELDHEGRVVGLAEKPRRPRSDLAIVGVYIFTPAVHEAVGRIRPSGRGELEITDAVQWLVRSGADVRSHLLSGFWKDTGNVTDMLDVNRTVLEGITPRVEGFVDPRSAVRGNVIIEPGAQIWNSVITGPTIIGSGSRITDSYIGAFTSVAEECRIATSLIESSIVLPGSSIVGVRGIGASLIGRNVEVTSAPHRPRAHRLVLGDHSKVQIPS